MDVIFKAFIDVSPFVDNEFDQFREWFLRPAAESLSIDRKGKWSLKLPAESLSIDEFHKWFIDPAARALFYDSLLSTDDFREWFINPPTESLLADQVGKLLATGQPHYFNNVLKLLDPYHSPGDWQAGYYFFTGLKTYFTVNPPNGNPLSVITKYIQDREKGEWRKFSLPHRIDGINLIYADPGLTTLDGLARLIWKDRVFGGRPPFLRHLLAWFPFFKKFSFIDELVRLIWHLRARFSTAPAVLGAVLSCCSLFDGHRPILQRLPFAKEFESLTIPREFKCSETAYSQIPELINEFCVRYNRFIDNLHLFGCTPVIDLKPSELLPHMIITLENIHSVIAEIAVSRLAIDSELPEVLLNDFKCSDIPLCRFVVHESPGKDFFGFTNKEWKLAFASPPFLNRIVVRDDGVRVSFPKLKSPMLKGHRPATDDSDSRTLLVCLCWIYCLDQEFPIAHFCDPDPGLETFVIGTYESTTIRFLRSKKQFSGPLDEYLPDPIRGELFIQD
jgi:hypothetical protein